MGFSDISAGGPTQRQVLGSTVKGVSSLNAGRTSLKMPEEQV